MTEFEVGRIVERNASRFPEYTWSMTNGRVNGEREGVRAQISLDAMTESLLVRHMELVVRIIERHRVSVA